MNTQAYCWSCNQPGGEMLHFGNIHIHNTPSCREISGLPEEEHDGKLDDRGYCTVKIFTGFRAHGEKVDPRFIELAREESDAYFHISISQALSLRDWLIQESPELERLAKEQEQ